MDTNSLTTAGCVLAFSVLVIGVLVLRALYRIADLDASIESLNYHCRCLSDNMQSMDKRHERELELLGTRTGATSKRLDAVMEEWSTLRADVEQLQKKVPAAGSLRGVPILESRVVKLERAADKIGHALYQLKAKVDFNIPRDSETRDAVARIMGRYNAAKPPIEQVPNPGE